MAGPGADFDIHAFLAQEALLVDANLENRIELKDLPSFYMTVWPKAADIVDGWINQELVFSRSEEGVVGILQPVNGPCGVLAVIQAVIFKQRLIVSGKVDVHEEVTDKEIAAALSEIICFHARHEHCQLATWTNEVGKNIVLTNLPVSAVEPFILSNVANFKSRGGICLLLYSIVASKTEASIKEDFKRGQSGPSLVETTMNKSIWFCSSDLMTLLLLGNADGNLGAYDQTGKKRVPQTKNLGIGLLSRQERVTNIPLLDEFKFPNIPVWILHSGDHFTVLAQETSSDDTKFIFFNGLPPGGPKLSRLELKFSQVSEKSREQIAQTDYVPLPGEIYDVVQASSESKASYKDFKLWNYEVILAVEDPSVKGPARPKDMVIRRYELGKIPKSRWRCAACYRNRHKTFCFGENKVVDGEESTPTDCKFCGKSKEEAQWSIWLVYEQLPLKWKRSVQFRYGPKILGILTTRWLDAVIVSPSEVEQLPSV